MDQTLTAVAVQLRQIMSTVSARWTFINNGAAGTAVAVLTEIGYDNTNASAPGGLTDAAYAAYLLNQLNTMASIYYGQAAQPSTYDFNNALASLWAAQ
jgi:tetrahydromethanopterin S-methyltransferase subunit D